MSNKSVKGISTIHGTDPQKLVDQIIRERVYESRFWKEDCFGLTTELLVDKIVDLNYIGGIYAENIKATPFLCLLLKMLQLQPEKEIIIEFLKNEEYKYMRALAAFYLRMIGTPVEIYNYLEPLYCDYRKLKAMDSNGNNLLRDIRVCDIALPVLQVFLIFILIVIKKRDVLEETEQLQPKKSALDEDLLEILKQESSDDKEK